MPPPVAWTTTGLVVCFSLGMALAGRPGFDKSPDPLRPKRSEAYETLARVKQRLGNAEEPLWVIVRGKDEAEVSQKLARLRQHLERHKALADFTLFDVLWPNPENQKANRDTVQYLLSRQPSVQALALKEGFTTNALAMTGRIFAQWRRALEQTNVFWPSGNISQWVMNKVAARDKQDALALAMVYPRSNAEIKPLLASWPKDFRQNGIVISGWQLLGAAVFELVLRELPRVIVPILLLVIFCLWLAFRDVREVVLSLAMLGFSALTLNGAMELVGWKWNMLNLMALPLLLGMAVDFSIHIQLALRKAKGDLLYVRRTVGKALLLAGATTIAGFGSLAFASTAGMASLGKTCALAIVIALVTAVYLLPVWWAATARGSRDR
jgi:predicted RND superfamily exporter protein